MARDNSGKDQEPRTGFWERTLRKMGEAVESGMASQTASKVQERKKKNCVDSGGTWTEGGCQF